MPTPLSGNTIDTLTRSIESLCADSEGSMGHLPTVEGLIVSAGLVCYGHPISDALRARLRKALKKETYGQLANELLGPP